MPDKRPLLVHELGVFRTACLGAKVPFLGAIVPDLVGIGEVS
jgi:hypothetical protein